MSRTKRLLDLMQALRKRKYPVSGATLAQELGISTRTLYRDIGTLQEQGAHIEGEPGVGYVLRPGFMLPPLMFSEEEIEAIFVGSQWVSKRTDAKLAEAARNALAKIASVLPDDLRRELANSTLLVPPGSGNVPSSEEIGKIRQAIRTGRKIEIKYRDLNGRESTRIVWPFALAFFDKVRMLAVWCELRKDYRHFRADRIQSLTVLKERYSRSRHSLLREWQMLHAIRLDE
jgi:predicted DNA-binding transcriptional regulator YafY